MESPVLVTFNVSHAYILESLVSNYVIKYNAARRNGLKVEILSVAVPSEHEIRQILLSSGDILPRLDSYVLPSSDNVEISKKKFGIFRKVKNIDIQNVD
jgi:hypothetical protein